MEKSKNRTAYISKAFLVIAIYVFALLDIYNTKLDQFSRLA